MKIFTLLSTTAACAAATFLVSSISEGEETELVQKDGIVLKIDAARLMIEAARKQAVSMNLKVNITVVDAGGHLLAFERMDGARPASIYTSMSKAATAALKQADTGKIGDADLPADVMMNLSIENTAAMSGGKFTTLDGGIAVILSGQTVGGIAAGGAKGTEDAVIARAGLDALKAALGE